MEVLRKQQYREKMRELGRVLRHKITIQKLADGTEIDEDGNQIIGWEDWRTEWAERVTLWGESYYAAKAVGEENKVIFRIRYAPAYEDLIHNVDQYKVVYKDTEFRIQRVDPLQDGSQWIKLECLERKPGEVSADQQLPSDT